LPTPAIGGVGVIEDAGLAAGIAIAPGLELILVGETKGELGQSLWLREVCGVEAGAPPAVDLAAERRNGDFVRAEILAGRVAACHDVADGGVLVAIAEMALAGETGVELTPHASSHAFWFGEDQARYVLAVADGAALIDAAKAAGVHAEHVGHAVNGHYLTLNESVAISLTQLRDAHERFFPAWFAL
jgi:phosphoribosylformylglycinamidine synthase